MFSLDCSEVIKINSKTIKIKINNAGSWNKKKEDFNDNDYFKSMQELLDVVYKSNKTNKIIEQIREELTKYTTKHENYSILETSLKLLEGFNELIKNKNISLNSINELNKKYPIDYKKVFHL
jgi:hypothetical protein